MEYYQAARSISPALKASPHAACSSRSYAMQLTLHTSTVGFCTCMRVAVPGSVTPVVIGCSSIQAVSFVSRTLRPASLGLGASGWADVEA